MCREQGCAQAATRTEGAKASRLLAQTEAERLVPASPEPPTAVRASMSLQKVRHKTSQAMRAGPLAMSNMWNRYQRWARYH